MNEETVLTDTVKYELMVIIKPDLGADATTARLGEIRKMLATKKNGVSGEIFFEEIWGMRDLAYNIKNNTRGFYAVMDFTHDPQAIREFETTLKLEPEVLRHMIVKLPFSYESKSSDPAVSEAEDAKAKAEAKEKKEEKPAFRKPVVVRKEEVKVEKAIEAKEETKEEPKKKETTLEDVDAKLKSIIENPDINF